MHAPRHNSKCLGAPLKAPAISVKLSLCYTNLVRWRITKPTLPLASINVQSIMYFYLQRM